MGENFSPCRATEPGGGALGWGGVGGWAGWVAGCGGCGVGQQYQTPPPRSLMREALSLRMPKVPKEL